MPGEPWCRGCCRARRRGRASSHAWAGRWLSLLVAGGGDNVVEVGAVLGEVSRHGAWGEVGVDGFGGLGEAIALRSASAVSSSVLSAALSGWAGLGSVVMSYSDAVVTGYRGLELRVSLSLRWGPGVVERSASVDASIRPRWRRMAMARCMVR